MIHDKTITLTRTPPAVVTLARMAVGGGGGAGSSYDDTEIRADIAALKAVDAELLESINDIATAIGNFPEMVVQALVDGEVVAWDAGIGSVATLALGGAGRTLASPTSLIAGRTYVLFVTNVAGTGTISTWGFAYKFPGAVKPPLSSTAGAVDMFTFVASSSSAMHLVTACFDSK